MSRSLIASLYGALLNFVLPEDKASLKLIFDNVRNYIICGSVYLLHLWLKSQPTASFSGILVSPAIEQSLITGFVLLIVYALAGFNLLQSYMLFGPTFRAIQTRVESLTQAAAERPSLGRSLLSLLVVVLWFPIALGCSVGLFVVVVRSAQIALAFTLK